MRQGKCPLQCRRKRSLVSSKAHFLLPGPKTAREQRTHPQNTASLQPNATPLPGMAALSRRREGGTSKGLFAPLLPAVCSFCRESINLHEGYGDISMKGYLDALGKEHDQAPEGCTDFPSTVHRQAIYPWHNLGLFMEPPSSGARKGLCRLHSHTELFGRQSVKTTTASC